MENVRITQANMLVKHTKMKDIVHEIMTNNERSRNDDKWLIIKVLEYTEQNIVIGQEAIVWHIPIEELGNVPNFETIRRVRAEIQNKDKELLPTDPQVLYDRAIKADAIKTYYADRKDLISQWEQIAYGVR